MEHIVIIGNGIAGVTLARHIRKRSDKRISIISSESDHFFSRTALMYVYMGHMKFEHLKPYEDHFWKKNRIDLIKDHVSRVDPGAKEIHLDGSGAMAYDKLILATGSRPRTLDRPGVDLQGVQALYSKGDLELLEFNARNSQQCKRAVVVGGGLIGIELVEMLASRMIPVTFLVRDNGFYSGVLPQGDSALVNAHILEHHIDLRLGATLGEVLSDGKGRVKSVRIAESGEEIPCDLVGLCVGVTPNIEFLRGSGIDLDRGVLVNRFLETNYRDVYALGDCAQQREPIGHRAAVEAVWYTGRIMGETLAATLCGQPRGYDPGPWFNSAKFLDLEYQTYGRVLPESKKGDSEVHFHWERAGEKARITMAFDREDRSFLGINALGIRLRHRVVDSWLRAGKRVEEVLEELGDAHFDPEFHRRWEGEILEKFNTDFGTSLKSKKRNLKRIFQPG